MGWIASLDNSRDVTVIEDEDSVESSWRVRSQGVGELLEASACRVVIYLLANGPRLARLITLSRCRADSGIQYFSFRAFHIFQRASTVRLLTVTPTGPSHIGIVVMRASTRFKG